MQNKIKIQFTEIKSKLLIQADSILRYYKTENFD